MEKKKRELCGKCELPLRTCLCGNVEKIENTTHFLVLRHKSEKKHALNTVRLCELSLAHIYVCDGENFDENDALDFFIGKGAQLVFPTQHSLSVEQVLKEEKKVNYFILIDGTWSKAKKIFFETKKLHSLTSIKFAGELESNYRIRKSNVQNGLSTLECITLLGSLFDQFVDYSPLERLFDSMVNKQIELMGEDVYKKNYR